jgi:dienelactone hydrolase
MELASNGYVVCSIDHPYHSLFTFGADGRLIRADQSFLQEVIGLNNGKNDEETKFKLEQKWLNVRTKDMNFVLDTILAHAKDTGSGVAYQRIDPEKIGLMGHSLGGAASAQVARERNDIEAVINLDANLFGEYLDYVDGKYVMNDKVYPVPILTIYSDDMVRLMAAVKNPNDVIAVKHVTASASKAYEIHIAGTNHMSLTDLPLVSPFLVSMINKSVNIGGGHEANKYYIIEKMNDIVLKFFNVYLKGEGRFSSAGTY